MRPVRRRLTATLPARTGDQPRVRHGRRHGRRGRRPRLGGVAVAGRARRDRRLPRRTGGGRHRGSAPRRVGRRRASARRRRRHDRPPGRGRGPGRRAPMWPSPPVTPQFAAAERLGREHRRRRRLRRRDRRRRLGEWSRHGDGQGTHRGPPGVARGLLRRHLAAGRTDADEGADRDGFDGLRPRARPQRLRRRPRPARRPPRDRPRRSSPTASRWRMPPRPSASPATASPAPSKSSSNPPDPPPPGNCRAWMPFSDVEARQSGRRAGSAALEVGGDACPWRRGRLP